VRDKTEASSKVEWNRHWPCSIIRLRLTLNSLLHTRGCANLDVPAQSLVIRRIVISFDTLWITDSFTDSEASIIYFAQIRLSVPELNSFLPFLANLSCPVSLSRQYSRLYPAGTTTSYVSWFMAWIAHNAVVWSTNARNYWRDGLLTRIRKPGDYVDADCTAKIQYIPLEIYDPGLTNCVKVRVCLRSV